MKLSPRAAALAALLAFGAALAQTAPSTGPEPALSSSKGQAYPTWPIRYMGAKEFGAFWDREIEKFAIAVKYSGATVE